MATTYYSFLQYRMEEQRLLANAQFKIGDFSAAVELYLRASELFETMHAKPNDESLSTASTSPAVAIATTSSPAAIRSALLEELTKSVGNACTSLYKLARYVECATISKQKGIERNPYFAKGHAFVGMSNINIISPLLAGAKVNSLTNEEKIIATQRLHEAVQRLFIAMLILPAMAGQVKASVAEGLKLIRTLQESSSAPAQNSEELIEVTKNTGGNGNGIVAKAPLAAGTLLARLSHPFSVAPYEGFQKHICVACGVPILSEAYKASEVGAMSSVDSQPATKTVKRGCDACQMVRYCSAACQNRYHIPRHLLHECAYMLKLKVMCEGIAERELDVPDEFAELATHAITTLSGLLVLKASPASFFDPTNKALLALESDTNKGTSNNADQGGESLPEKAHKIRCSVLALESHSVEVAQTMHPTLPLVCEMLSVEGFGDRGAVRTLTDIASGSSTLPALDEHLVATLIGIVRCNAMEIADPSGLGVAQGLFAIPASYLSLFPREVGNASTSPANSNTTGDTPLSACHFNHSCDPNAMFDVKAQEIRTICPVPKGAEITISYIPQLYWPANLRREGLAERFYFTCSCDRCSPYRRAAVEKEKREALDRKAAAAASRSDAAADASSPLSAALALLATVDDSEVSAIYDKISAAEKPAAAIERPGATKYYYNNMLGVCGGIRQRPVEEIIAAQTETTVETEAADGSVETSEVSTPAPASAANVTAVTNPLVKEVKVLADQCSTHLEPWHFVLHDIHNTQTFLNSVLGDHSAALVSSMEELLTFEACVAGGVPAKADKLKNIAACVEGLVTSSVAAGADASQYVATTVLGSECTSPHKDVLAMLWAQKAELLDTLLAIHTHQE